MALAVTNSQTPLAAIGNLARIRRKRQLALTQQNQQPQQAQQREKQGGLGQAAVNTGRATPTIGGPSSGNLGTPLVPVRTSTEGSNPIGTQQNNKKRKRKLGEGAGSLSQSVV